MESSTINKKVEDENRYWIHKVDVGIIEDIHKKKVLAGKNILPKKFKANDRLILFTTLNRRVIFFAYTMVDEVIKDNSTIYDIYSSKRKLKLKGIKYFVNPIYFTDVSRELSFSRNHSNSSDSIKSQFKIIPKEDFLLIHNKSSLTKDFPTYFEDFSMPVDEFILKTIEIVYEMLKLSKKRKQIEIKRFIWILKKVLDTYGIKKNYDEVKEFYVKNVWILGFKHNPSRDQENTMLLYTESGSKKNFSYISLE